MNQQQIEQMILENMGAIRQGVGRVTQSLGLDVHADLVADVTLALLEKRGASFDPNRASAAVFCRMVSYQIALDKFRAMKRGGQFSGAYAGIGNHELDAPSKADNKGETNSKEMANQANASAWLNDARATIAPLIATLSTEDQELWELMADGFDATAYAEAHNVAVATAYVRANRLRAKVRDLLADAA